MALLRVTRLSNARELLHGCLENLRAFVILIAAADP